MKSFSERNPVVIGAVGVALTTAIVLAALQYDKLPFFSGGYKYVAYFAEAGGLRGGDAVQVAGFRVGQVSSVGLEGNKVLVNFDVAKNIRLGERTEAAIKTKSLLGSKILEIEPRGDGRLAGPIPVDRTTPPYQLPDALGDLTNTISGLNTGQLSDALKTLGQTFQDTPPDLRVAVQGAARFSETLDKRDAQLRNLLANANKVTHVLAERADQVVSLIVNANALLAQLRTESNALDQLAGNVSALSKQLSGFVADNRAALRPALDKLNGVLTILDNHKKELKQSLNMFAKYAMGLGEAVTSGPFFKAYLGNLLPGQFLQPFIDAAFSDLGLDPSVLLPSQLHDPQTGQPGTPPLPVPYPRTGQGGAPRTTLPDAITGKPGDPRYPYRPPLPAPAPGGPPPGPPAGYTPTPVPAGRSRRARGRSRSSRNARVPAHRWAVWNPATSFHGGRKVPAYPAARMALAVSLTVLLVTGLFVALHAGATSQRTTVTAYFDNTNGIFAGDDVRILGVAVGKIDKIEPQPERAKVQFWFDAKYQVPADASAVILSPSLVTARSIQLTPAYTHGPTMQNNAVIPQSRTAVPVEWDDMRAQLQKLTDALQPTEPGGVSTLGAFINTAAGNLRGQGANIRDTIIKLSQAFSVLGDHSGDISGSVKNLSILVSALHSSTDLMKELNTNLAGVTALLADEPNGIGNALRDLNTAVGDVQTFVGENRESLGTTSDKLASVTSAVIDNLDNVKQILHIGPTAFQNFVNIYQPAQSALTGIAAFSNFSDPISFLCGAIQAASRLGAEQSAKLCVQYLAPIIKNRQYNFPPIGLNPFVGAQARPNEVTYSEDWLRPDYVPPQPPSPPGGRPPSVEQGPPTTPQAEPDTAPVLPSQSTATDPADGLPGMMVPPGGGS